MDNVKKSRTRAPNFTPSESHHLCGVLEQYKHIIENKRTDGASLQDKQKAWLKVVNDYNSSTTSYTRTLESLQQCYKNIKKKAKKQLSSTKMSIPVDREVLVQSIEQHGSNNWQLVSDSVGVSQSVCKEEFEEMKKQVKIIDKVIKKDILATGGGPSTQPEEDSLLNKVRSLVGPTLDGLHTIYDGDSTLMESQGIAPIEEIILDTTLPIGRDHETEDVTYFNNDRANLKRKPHPKLDTNKIRKITKNETVSDKFKSLAGEKMEVVLLQKELLKKQLLIEDERLINTHLEQKILQEKLAQAKTLRAAAELSLKRACEVSRDNDPCCVEYQGTSQD